MGHKKYLQKLALTQSYWLYFSRKERNTFVLNERWAFLCPKIPWQNKEHKAPQVDSNYIYSACRSRLL